MDDLHASQQVQDRHRKRTYDLARRIARSFHDFVRNYHAPYHGCGNVAELGLTSVAKPDSGTAAGPFYIMPQQGE
jgi:hypothetical protein